MYGINKQNLHHIWSEAYSCIYEELRKPANEADMENKNIQHIYKSITQLVQESQYNAAIETGARD